jgi:hypothetical protein
MRIKLAAPSRIKPLERLVPCKYRLEGLAPVGLLNLFRVYAMQLDCVPTNKGSKVEEGLIITFRQLDLAKEV